MTIAERRQVRAQVRAHRRAAGLCMCGRSPLPGRTTCELCAARNRATTAAARRARARAGMCRQCSRPRGPGPFCREHRAGQTMAAYRARQAQWLDAQWLAEDRADEALTMFVYSFAIPVPSWLPPEGR